MKPLPYQRYIPLQLILWEYHRALKCFALASLDQKELFNFPSNALFCILEVWKNFIRTVVACLLSRGTNFHSNKNIRNYQHKADSSISDFILKSMNVMAATNQLDEPWEQKLVTEKCE